MNMIVPSTLPWRQRGDGLQVPRRNRLAGLGDGTDSTIDLSGDFIASTPTYTSDPGFTVPDPFGIIAGASGGGTSVYNPSTLNTSSSSGGGLSAQQIAALLAGGASAASSITRSLQNPSVIPGTNTVYNPATGQMYNPSTGQVVSSGSSVTSLASSVSPMVIIAIAGIAAFMFLSKS